MNSLVPRPISPRSRALNPRAQLSPLLRRSMETAVARHRFAAQLGRAQPAAIPAADTLTPATPSLLDRWWDPHLVDRLQTPLTRIHE